MSDLQQTSAADLPGAAPVISLLSEFWLQPVDTHLADVWNDHFAALYLHSTGKPAVKIEQSSLEQLVVDYTRVFVGPRNHLPPIQSVWTDGQLVSAATRSMQTYCGRLGVSAPVNGTPVDHIGWQLSVLALMLAGQGGSQVADVLAEYAQAHLSWVDGFLAQVVVAGGTGLYSQVAELTQVCIADVRCSLAEVADTLRDISAQ